MSAALALSGSAALVWGTSDFLACVYSRRVPVRTIVIWSKGVGGVLGLATLLMRGQPPPGGAALALGVLAGLVGLPAMGLLCLVMRDSSVLMVAPIAAAAAAIPLLWGIAGGERFGWLGVVGLVTALLGITLANWPITAARMMPANPFTACCAAGAATATGSYFVLLHQASTSDPYGATAVARTTQAVAVVVLAAGWRRRRSVAPVQQRRASTPAVLAVIGMLDSTGDAAFAIASTLGPLGVASVLASLYSAVTVVLGTWILRERIHSIHAVGVVAATLGAACLSAWPGT